MSFFSALSFDATERSARTVASRIQLFKTRLPDWAQDWLEIIVPGLQILLILFAAWVLQRLLRRIVRRASEHSQMPQHLLAPINRLIRTIIYASVLLLVLERMGVSATVLWTAFTGFATVGAVAFFAAWSVLSNLFCAFLIFVVGPFRVGDHIEVLDLALDSPHAEASAPQISNSDRPTFTVPDPTFVTVNLTLVTVRLANVTWVAEPSLFNCPTATVDPSENPSDPPVTQSDWLGLSNSTTRPTSTGAGKDNSIHAPTVCLAVAHSLV